MSSTKDERTALIALYDKTGGTNWIRKTNWKTNLSVSKWFGVKTNTYGQVVGLALFRNKLSGPIPVELAQLHNLEYLLLSRNELSGPIPVELAQLSHLESLILAGNADLYAPADAEFQAWVRNLKKFSVDKIELPPPVPARDDVLPWGDVSLGAIERLLDAVKPPSDRTQTLELLESFLCLAETLKKKVGAMGDGAANMQVVAASIEKLQDDLTELEKTIAEVAKQTEEAAQQQSELDAKNAELEAELEAKKAELDTKKAELEAKKAELEAKKAELEAKKAELDTKKAELEKACGDLEKAGDLLNKFKEEEIPRIEAAIQQINDKSADFALRVEATGQKFHAVVEEFLQSERKRLGIMQQIGDTLRLHRDDDAQILEALKQGEDSEPANLDEAICLVDAIAENLGDLDRCLGTLTKERDSTS